MYAREAVENCLKEFKNLKVYNLSDGIGVKPHSDDNEQCKYISDLEDLPEFSSSNLGYWWNSTNGIHISLPIFLE